MSEIKKKMNKIHAPVSLIVDIKKNYPRHYFGLINGDGTYANLINAPIRKVVYIPFIDRINGVMTQMLLPVKPYQRRTK